MANIGFIGLGHMGFPMACNLVKANHQVSGFDLQATALEAFSQEGGLIAPTLNDVAKGKDILITMLQTGQQVKQVCEGNEGVFQHLASHSLHIDCSTIDVNSSREIHQLAREKQLLSVDAPVSGGVAGAAAGTLTFMVGGEQQAFHAAHPILACMGQKIIHAGKAGSGQAAKICNNMILGISMVAISEAFTLAKELGLAEDKLFEVVNNSSGQCWALSKYVPVPGILEQVPANNHYKPGFAAQMMLKDLLLSQNASNALNLNTPLGAKTTELYKEFVSEGHGDLDFSAIIQLIAQKHGV